MNPAGQIAGVVLVVGALVGGGAVLGYQSRDGQVRVLQQKLHAETSRANGSDETLVTIKGLLAAERQRRNEMQQAVAEELSARADRIAQLQAAVERRRNTINTEASQDEDCHALRRLPVCTALARGLWGDPAATAPH